MFRICKYNRSYLDTWNLRMKSPNKKPLVDSVVVAILKKQGFGKIEYTPRNIYDPDALYEALSYYAPEHSHYVSFEDAYVKAGRDFSFKAFAKPFGIAKLKAVRLDRPMGEIFNLLQIKGSKSSGLTAYGMNKLEAFPIAMRKVREILTMNKTPDPCLAGVRTQAGKKGRLVWGYPLAMTILEGIIARPLLEAYTSLDCTPMAFAKTSAQMGIQMRKAVGHNDYYVSMDASKFDTTIQAGVIKFAFNALKTWFDLKQQVGFGKTVGDIFDIVENYFIHTPIVMPSEDGPLLYKGKRHGVPSGSYFTQIVDSIANTMMIGAIDAKFKLKVRLDECFVLGDDMLFFTDKRPNLQGYADYLSSTFYMQMNTKKSVFGHSDEDIHFLGREWSNGFPFREYNDAVARAVSPERYRNYGQDKWKGASAVLASYGFTAILRGVPQNIDPFMSLASHKLSKNAASGLTEFLIQEGLIYDRVSAKLY